MQELKAGDVLSYSSGSHNRGPYGFRALRKGGNLRAYLEGRWPQLFEGFGGRLPLVINAYPAALGTFEFGVYVDTYLSLSTGSRALHLAHLENMPVMLLGQPLYIADLLYRHMRSEDARLPDTLLIGSGGYVMPCSLEMALRELCAPQVKHLNMFHGYGVAEVDAGCLLAVRRDDEGQLVYERRSEHVGVDFGDHEELLLSLRDNDGQTVIDRFPTGDSGRAASGGYVVWNDERLHPNVYKILESWTPDDWSRRTGYLYYGREVRFQLRKGEKPTAAIECEFHDYEKRYGHYWLFKPQWSRVKDGGRSAPLRRTIM
jgi:hypothetical protein